LEQQQERYRKEIAAELVSMTWHGTIKGKIRSWLFKEVPPNPSKILNKTASAHYNGMIYPLAPFPIKGVIWYQGEEEALERRAEDHGRELPLLIGDWRRIWENPKLPFIIQQLPEFKGFGVEKTEWAELREAQAQVVEKTPRAYLVCGFGTGEVEGLHPANKREIGRRWEITALKEIYGMKMSASGPVFDSMKVESGEIWVHFKNAKGLITTDGQMPLGFLIAGEDCVFVPAKARIDGTSIVLSSEKVSAPKAVRYAFQNAPMDLNLTNDSGFPAFPFRTDAP
jgi:sialate O-acetylesterase